MAKSNHPYRPSGDAEVLYVSPRGNEKWTGRLAEPNPYDSDGPLPTVSWALQRLKEYPPSRPVVILVEGTHFLDQPLVLTPDLPPLTLRGAPGARLSGGRIIEGLVEIVVNGQRRWTARLEDVSAGKRYFREVRVGDSSRPRARLPKRGAWRIKDVPGMRYDGFIGPAASHHERFLVEPGQVRSDWNNFADIDAVAVHYWLEERLPLVSVDDATGLVTTAVKPWFPLKDDVVPACARFWLENVGDALSEPGEWYLDRRTGAFTYLPQEGENLDTTEVVAASLDHLIAIRGEAGWPVQGMHIEDLILSDVDWAPIPGRGADDQAAWSVSAMVRMEHARQCGLARCRIGPGGPYGVEIGPGCMGDRIEDCVFRDLGAGGIQVFGDPGESGHRCSHHRIHGNEITDCTRIFLSAVGILVRHSSHNDILANHIHHLVYSGISAGWVWGFGDSATHHNRLEDNHIHHLGTGLLNDMGGIYTLGEQPGTVIRHNHIHDIRAEGYGGWAIYSDEGSSYLVIEENLCHDTTSECFNLHYGRENILRNNVFARAGLGVVSVSAVGADWNSLTLTGNIIVTRSTPVLVARDHDRLTQCGFRSDLNCFWDADGGAVSGGDEERDATGKVFWKRTSLPDLQKLGYDRHSLIADPHFVDSRWLLPENSPAWSLGFKSFTAAGTRVGLPQAQPPG